jgi:cell division protein FtsB
METDPRTPGLVRRRRSERRRRIVRLAVLFAAAALLASALVGDNGLTTLVQTRRQAQDLQAEVARLRAESARLREEARRLREDPAAIEELARRELGMIRPGEKLFVLAPK